MTTEVQKRTADLRASGLDWEGVRVFLAVARAGSARGAAQELGMHYTSISRQIAALEQKTGGRLFDRSQNGFLLTQLGHSIVRHAEEMEAAALAVEREISGADERIIGTLTLATTTSLAAYLLADDIRDFTATYPGIKLHVRTGYSFADLARGEAEVTIRASDRPGDELVGRRMATYHECVYATPKYLARHSPWLAGSECRWLDWRTEDSMRKRQRKGMFPLVERVMSIGDEVLLLELTKNGTGMGTIPCFYGDTTPGLVRVDDTPTEPMLGIWLLSHPDLVKNARVRAFLDFFGAALAGKEPLLGGQSPAGG